MDRQWLHVATLSVFSLKDQSPLQTIFTYLLVEGTFRV